MFILCSIFYNVFYQMHFVSDGVSSCWFNKRQYKKIATAMTFIFFLSRPAPDKNIFFQSTDQFKTGNDHLRHLQRVGAISRFFKYRKMAADGEWMKRLLYPDFQKPDIVMVWVAFASCGFHCPVARRDTDTQTGQTCRQSPSRGFFWSPTRSKSSNDLATGSESPFGQRNEVQPDVTSMHCLGYARVKEINNRLLISTAYS